MYLDESGDTGTLSLVDKRMQPTFCISGIIIPESRLMQISHEWVDIKKQFYPKLCSHGRRWDWHTIEIKGNEIRSAIRSSSRKRRHAFGFIDKTIDLLKSHNCAIVSRVCIKTPGIIFKGNSVYTSSVQALCENFQEYLLLNNAKGVVVADSRSQKPNVAVAHSIFTMRVGNSGDSYPNMADVPLFGHSDNHAGLQIADIIASSLITPICINHCVPRDQKNKHSNPKYGLLAERYCTDLETLHFQYGPTVHRRGGLVISNPVSKIGTASLFDKYCKTNHTTAPIQPATLRASSHR